MRGCAHQTLMCKSVHRLTGLDIGKDLCGTLLTCKCIHVLLCTLRTPSSRNKKVVLVLSIFSSWVNGDYIVLDPSGFCALMKDMPPQVKCCPCKHTTFLFF